VVPLLSVAKPFDAAAAAPAFYAWSAFPDDAFWVNLHPHEPGRMIDAGLQATDTGRALLQADLQLKKTAAALLHPDAELGARFWDAVYDRAGLRDSKLCYSLRQWITPGKVEVLEAGTPCTSPRRAWRCTTRASSRLLEPAPAPAPRASRRLWRPRRAAG